MKKLLFLTLSVVITASLFLASCKKSGPSPAPSIEAFTFVSPISADGIIDQSAKTITISVPYGTDLSSVTVKVVGTAGAAYSPDINSPIDFSSLSVTISITKGGNTVQYTVKVVIGPNPLQLILIGEAPTIGGITNPEIENAYQWALETYKDKAKYICFDSLTSAELKVAKVIWFHYDTTNHNKVMPANAINPANLKKITDWYKAGGNLLLTTHASLYLVNLGRIPADLAPNAGGDSWIANPNPDNWGMSFIESGDSLFDAGNSQSPLFTGLTLSTVTFSPAPPYKIFWLLDGGLKRDNGALWDFNQLQILKDSVPDPAPIDARKNMFEKLTNSVVRGSFEWDPAANGIELGTLVEFKPTNTYKGTAVVISCGAYEWYQSDGRTNQWRSNITTLTSNAIKYLGVQ